VKPGSSPFSGTDRKTDGKSTKEKSGFIKKKGVTEKQPPRYRLHYPGAEGSGTP
jgi:hypothetical protein